MDVRKIDSLTILRWPLALWVVLHHSMGFVFGTQNVNVHLPVFNRIIYILYQTGSIAPQVFIVISGFVIAKSYSQRAHENKSVLKFYLRRICALYPLYLCCLIYAFLVFPTDRNYLLSHILLIQAFLPGNGWFTLNGPDWSISAEFFLYSLFPIIYFFLKKIKKRSTVQLTLLVTFLIYVGLYVTLCSTLSSAKIFYVIYHFPPFQIFNFTFGTLLYFIWEKSTKELRFQTQLKYLSFVIFFISIYLTYCANDEGFKLGIFLTPSALLIVFVLANSNSKKRISTSKKFLVFLGEGTFTFYITHWLWLGFIRNMQSFFTGIIAPFTIFLVITVLFSAFCSFLQKNVVNEFAKYLLDRTRPKNLKHISLLFIFPILSLTWPNSWSVQTIPHDRRVEGKLVRTELFSNSQNVSKLIVTFNLKNNSQSAIKIANCTIIDRTSSDKIQISQPYPYNVVGNFELAPGESAFFKTAVPQTGTFNLGVNSYLIGCN